MIPELYRKDIKADVIVVKPSRNSCDEKLLAATMFWGASCLLWMDSCVCTLYLLTFF